MDDNTFDDSMSAENSLVRLERMLLSTDLCGIPSTPSCES